MHLEKLQFSICWIFITTFLAYTAVFFQLHEFWYFRLQVEYL